MALVDVREIYRKFENIQALDGVSFTVEEGEIFGLLGPNGAGKTTLVRIITGVLRPNAGRVLIGGREISPATRDVRRIVGVVPQQITVYEDLTAWDNLLFWGRLYGLRGADLRSRIEELLVLVGLEARAKDRLVTYSGGMKRRLNLCMGLIHKPKVLILDEPTLGIDPQARLLLLDRVREIASTGTAVIYTTHYLEEAESICSRIAIIDHGRVLTMGSLAELLRQVRHKEIIKLHGAFDPERDGERFQAFPGFEIISLDDENVVLEPHERNGIPGILSTLLSEIPQIQGISVEKPTLESLFIQLTGRELRDQ